MPISIHATLAGGDSTPSSLYSFSDVFLSTPPSRVATVAQPGETDPEQISIHATLAGGDP